MRLYVSLRVLIGLYEFLLVFMGPYRSLCVLKDSNGFLWVLISPYESLLVVMGPYRSLWVLWSRYWSILPKRSSSTANNPTLYIPLYKTTRLQKSIRYQGVKIWNKIPTSIKTKQSFQSFKVSYKNYLLNMY